MSVDPLSKYQQAIEDLRRAKGRVDSMVEMVQETARALEHPSSVMVANVGAGFPPEVALSGRSHTINTREWPDGNRMGEILAGWHAAIQQAKSAYSSIPEGQRKVVQPVPEELMR